jgi:hypothetical protein
LASALAEPVDKYAFNSAEFLGPELAAMAAGSVEAQRGKKDVSPEDEAIRQKFTPAGHIGYQARIDVLPLPANISVFIIAGFPGSGVCAFAKGAAKMARECGAAVIRVDTDLFFGDNPRSCDVCATCCSKRPVIRPHKCRQGPASINVDWVNSTINAAAEKMKKAPI